LLTLWGVGSTAIGPVVLTLCEQAFGSYAPALVVLCVVPAAALTFALVSNDEPSSPIRARRDSSSL